MFDKNPIWLRSRQGPEKALKAKQIFTRHNAGAPEPNYNIWDMTWRELVEAKRDWCRAAEVVLQKAGAENRAQTTEETEAIDLAIDFAAAIGSEMDIRTEHGDRSGTRSSGRLPGTFGKAKPGGWRTQDGQPVTVLTREQSFGEYARRDAGQQDELSLGDVCRIMINGARNDAERRALSEGTDSAGGFTVNPRLSAELIDLMRAKARVMEAGAITVPMDTRQLKIARLATDPTATWHAENSQESDNSPTFEQVGFTAKTLISIVRASRELLDDSVNMNDALKNAFANALANEFDRVAIYGAGGNEPTGLNSVSGTLNVPVNVALTDYDELVDAYWKLLQANANAPTAALMHPRIFGDYAKMKDTTNQPLQMPELIRSMPLLPTTQMSLDEGGSPAGTSIWVGDWTELMFGVRAEVRIELLKERYADFYQYAFLAHLRGDIQVKHPASFCRISNIEYA